MKKVKTHEDYVAKVAIVNPDIEILELYVNAKTKILHCCKIDGNTWLAAPTNILSGKGCPVCAVKNNAKKFTKTQEQYENEVSQIDPNIKVVGKYVNYHTKIFHRCLVDNTVWLASPNSILNGSGCPTCGDGVSYPEKLMSSILQQLNINFTTQYSPKWIKPLRYDFCFNYQSQSYLIEMDGGIGHGNSCCGINVDGEKTKSVDECKDKKAQENNMMLIRINCDYKSCDRLEYIKNHIIKSILSSLFNLDIIDWELCDKLAQQSLFVKTIELWNAGMKNHYDIASTLKLHPTSITTYLKRSEKLKITDYNHKEYRNLAIKNSRRKASITQSTPIRCIETGEIFLSIHEANQKYHCYVNHYFKGNHSYAGKTLDGIKLHWERLSEEESCKYKETFYNTKLI